MSLKSYYSGKKVLITGGAGFIGSHLADRLIKLGSTVTILDNFYSGQMNNVLEVFKLNNLNYKKQLNRNLKTTEGHSLIYTDLNFPETLAKTVKGHEIVFHLAAVFGGRGFIDAFPATCCDNFALNTNIIKASQDAKVEKIIFSSSACVYPTSLQNKYNSRYLLKEEDALRDNWANSDDSYGWAKMMGEIALKSYYNQYGLQSAVTRYVTAYGPRENDTHAIIALIKRALKKENPYIVWGSGNQDRDFTYVDDIVEGTLRAGEKISDSSAVNLGTSRRYKIKSVAKMILELTGHNNAKLIFDTSKPEGVASRALSISYAEKILAWRPKIDLESGLRKTITWYAENKPKSVETIK